MRPRFVVRQRAARESNEAFFWYEARRPGLGGRFRSELERVLDRIVEAPAQFPLVEQSVRIARLHSFPYEVYFSFKDDRVVILSVLHHGRHPDTWKRRD
jgi:plasmid stabilization system protein ParE